MESKSELKGTKAVNLRSNGNFNQANVSNDLYGPIIKRIGVCLFFGAVTPRPALARSRQE